MKLVKSYLTKNPCYKNNQNAKALYDSGQDKRYWTFQQRGPQGLMLHSVGCAQPSASVFINSWNQESYDYSCVHGVIDANDGTVYQCLPWNYRGWHGGGSSNNTHVGVEMCESKYIRYLEVGESGYAPGKFVIKDKAKAQADCTRAYKAAVELFASICKEFNLNPLISIVSHYEGGKQGIASGHGDPEHYWKGLGMSYTMDKFRADVKLAMQSKVFPFVDVPDGKFYTEPIRWAWENEIVEGVDETHFKPDNKPTRGQVITLLFRFAKYLEERGG